MVEKTQKVLLTLALVTVFLPFIFAEKYTIHYDYLGDRTYSTPRFELFVFPVAFLVLTVLTGLWKEELKNKFG